MTADMSKVASAFEAEGMALDGEAASEAERIQKFANITPADLVCKWEAWSMTRNRPAGPPTARELVVFGDELKRRAADAKPLPGPPLVHRARQMPRTLEIDDFFSAYDDRPVYLGGAPAPAADSAPMDVDHRPPSPEDKRASVIVGGGDLGGTAGVKLPADDDDAVSAEFASRQGIGKSLAKLNESPGSSSDGKTSGVRIRTLSQYTYDDSSNPFTYMNDNLRDASGVIRARIRAVGERILARRAAEFVVQGVQDPCPPPSPEAFFAASPNVVLALGRIRVELDGGGGGGRINLSSVLLESEDGNVLKLNLGRIKAARKRLLLSPGMIVVAEGVNTTGRILDVHAVYDNSIPLPSPSAPQIAPSGPPVARCVVAAGPYTVPGNLKFEPLDQLLEHVVSSKPDVVLLTGPFVEETHKLIDECLPIEFSTLFDSRVLKRILAAREQTPRTNFVAVPAISDVHHERVCPQPAFKLGSSVSTDNSVHFVSNPSAIVVSNADGSRSAVLGVTSLPTLSDMSGDSISSDVGDRLASFASHMVRQWNFYPQSPGSVDVPIDYSHLEQLDFPLGGIDILVAPSKLNQFVKVADGDVVAVNPGMLCRGATGGGSYAVLNVPLHRIGESHVKAAGPSSANTNAVSVYAEIFRL